MRGRGRGGAKLSGRMSEFQSEDPGFDPLAGGKVARGSSSLFSFFIPPRQLMCRLVCAFVCLRHAPKFVRTLKVPPPMVWSNRNTAYRRLGIN